MTPWRASLLVALVLVIAAPHAEAKGGAHAGARVMAPVFTLPTRHENVCSDSLRGKVVVLDFWASWCGPCRASFPWLRSLHERFADRGVVVVAVNLDKSRNDADAFLAKYPAPFTVAFDPEGKTPEAYKVAAMPTTFIIGRDGTILNRHAGFDPKQTAAVEALIREACGK